MSNLGATLIDSLRASIPDARASVRYTGNAPELAGNVETALCTGLDQQRAQTGEGMITGSDGAVRYKLADEPRPWRADGYRGHAPIVGQVVTVTLNDGTSIKCRVDVRRETAGAVRLNVSAQYGER